MSQASSVHVSPDGSNRYILFSGPAHAKDGNEGKVIELLKNNGIATEEEIATVILNRDPTQLDYYIDKVKKMG